MSIAMVEPVRVVVFVVGLVGKEVPDGDQHRVGDDEDGLGVALRVERTVSKRRHRAAR